MKNFLQLLMSTSKKIVTHKSFDSKVFVQMTQEKCQPLGKTCEREILCLFIKSTKKEKTFSQKLSHPEDKVLALKFVPTL